MIHFEKLLEVIRKWEGMMSISKCLFVSGLLCLFILLLASGALAQECHIVKDYQDGSCLVKINNKTVLAISEEMEKNMLKMQQDLLDARREIAEKNKLLVEYENFKAQYKITLNHQQEYIKELESVLEGYKGMHAKYKELKEPWLTIEAGVGATEGVDPTGNSDPAVILGLGIRQIRVWGFIQENNTGALIGLTYPIF